MITTNNNDQLQQQSSLSTEQYQQILLSTQQYVKQYMSKYDTSHDYNHVLRVVSNALNIAKQENINNIYDLQCIEVAAYLHDIDDHKYITDNNINANNTITQFLINHCHLNQQQYNHMIQRICNIIEHVSYSKEIYNISINNTDVYYSDKCIGIVQDADRLDAIGSIGITRCLIFGTVKQHVLYDPNNMNKCTIQHFYDKLFKLKDMMKTSTGKELATDRHNIMVQFVDSFKNEWCI